MFPTLHPYNTYQIMNDWSKFELSSSSGCDVMPIYFTIEQLKNEAVEGVWLNALKRQFYEHSDL